MKVKRFVVAMEDTEENAKKIYLNGEEYFTLQEAKEHIVWMNKVYPSDKGILHIYELSEIKTEILTCSCGAKAEFVCDCGSLLCGEDKCEKNCGGSVKEL
jgi:hypothetical protein